MMVRGGKEEDDCLYVLAMAEKPMPRMEAETIGKLMPPQFALSFIIIISPLRVESVSSSMRNMRFLL